MATSSGNIGRSTAKAQLAWARTVLTAEAGAITSLSTRLDGTFIDAIELLHACKGRIITTGIGKPGFIAQKLSATLASTGVASLYLHPAEAAHGDLGRVVRGDVVIALSNSGTTEEILRLLVPLKRQRVKVVALTSDPKSPLARGSDVVLDIGAIDEACPIGLVPTASSAALHALSDALAMTLAWRRELTPEGYARFHPGGKLGRSVLKVSEVMREGTANPLVRDSASLSQALVVMTNTPGRPGATNVVDRSGKLVGIFTDGDFRRLAEQGAVDLKGTVASVMAKRPRTIGPNELVLTAATIMRETKVDQLPVVDSHGRPVGLVDVQDLLAARVV
ncbi:MAG: KpsF/GutQ family sugar-phosphate isomerase [Myxococcales bacterium]|nr:KpsF/GutQ family sugar-phosphate isomerase [Myxococcales bacterium]